jgi:hypothetical protein
MNTATTDIIKFAGDRAQWQTTYKPLLESLFTEDTKKVIEGTLTATAMPQLPPPPSLFDPIQASV